MSSNAGPSSSTTTLKTSKLSPVVLDSHSSSGIGSNISLHPLPILNISEHLVRTRLQSNDTDLTVYGVLLGTQQGRDINIQNSFEIRLDPSASPTSAPMINHAFLKSRQSQYKQVFPTLDLLGWYTIGDLPTPQGLEIHKQLLAYNETPIFVQLHQTVSSFENAEVNGELPIRVYESVVEMVQGETTNFFVPAGFKIETGEAERIAVDHASKAGAESGGDHESAMLTSMQAQHGAISKLHDRIHQVLGYLQAVKGGQAAWDHEALRQIQTVVANLPQTVLPELQEELLREHNDVLLTNYLSVLTENLHTMNEVSAPLLRTNKSEGLLPSRKQMQTPKYDQCSRPRLACDSRCTTSASAKGTDRSILTNSNLRSLLPFAASPRLRLLGRTWIRVYGYAWLQLTDKFEVVQAGGKDENGADAGGILAGTAPGVQGRKGGGGAAGRSSALRAVYR